VSLRRTHTGLLRSIVTLAVLAIIAVACGGDGDGGGEGQATGPQDEGTPQRGGQVVYGLEAETLGGWCMPVAQLAAGGIQVAGTVYDTLTVPSDKDGEYVPYLAKSVEHNPEYTEWTITLREGITFHNGEPFNAQIVKNNLDAYRRGILFTLVFADVSDVQVTGPMTVKVIMRRPWVAFPATLWATGRLGMVAQEQLDEIPKPNNGDCARPPKLIGTGAFRAVSWTPNDRFVAERNPNYWQKDENGIQLPYLDRITFRPIPDVSQRVNGLKAGDLDVIHTSDGEHIFILRQDAKAGAVKIQESTRAAEISHVMLHAGKPPFDNVNARLAVAYAGNAKEANDVAQRSVNKLAKQPFAPETLGYQEDPPFPTPNVARSREHAEKYRQETGQELTFQISYTNDPATQKLAQIFRSQMEEAGIRATLGVGTEQSQYINLAIQGNYQAILWRNFPGGDSDTLYIWWRSKIWNPATQAYDRTNYVNFGRINDPEIDAALDAGRVETDQVKRREHYQAVGAEFAKEAYNLWTWYTTWAFASKPDVNGIVGPKLPDGQERGLPIASVQPVLGLWRG
jgi:peptide/nickel transport system substrate-binding protein